MPYINQKKREKYDDLIKALHAKILNYDENKDEVVFEEGDVNYIISSLMLKLFKTNTSYQTVNKVIGVLECIKLELYRTRFSIYEDKKKEENGDL